jgi:hypothetical protein
MTVLVGGLRVLGANAGRPHGVFTERADAEQRLLRQSARHGHGLGRTSAPRVSKGATARPASRGRARGSI